MANKIGIVLALDGEKEFTQGMKAAQQSAKLFEQNLKNLESEYKGNANSIEALTKKQEQLTNKQQAYNRELDSAKSGQQKAIENYKKAGERLDELKEDLDKAKKAMKDMEDAGDSSSSAYKKQAKAVEDLEKAVSRQADEHAKASTNITKWDTAVAKAEGDVSRANSAVEKNAKYLDEASHSADGCAKSIDKMGREADEAGDEMNKMGISLKDMIKAKAVDLAGDALRELGQKAVEAAKYVIEVGSQFEASMSKVAALSGASAEELDRMSQKAQELGSSTKFSASEVADGFSYMALAGWDANQSIAAIDGIVNLAAASEMDLAQASDMVTDYLSAFGMEASRAGEMADMMAYAQANSNTTTAQLGEAFGNCAANMNAAGQDMKTTTSFLEAFANQGIKGSEAGTKLSAIMRDITAKMEDGKIQIGDTAVAVTDANGNFRDLTDIMLDVEAATEGMGTAERSAALSATFTSRSVGGLNMILAEGVSNIAGYEEALENCDGAASTMAGTMQNNLQGAITEMNSAAEGLGIALYDQVSGPLTDAVRLATELISSITERIAPEQTALDQFIESTKAVGEEARAAIDNANATLDKGEADVARLTAMSDTIKEANEQFGLFAKVDTSAVSEDLASTATGVSESAGNIEESAQAVIDAMNMDDVDTSGASEDLSATESNISSSASDIEADAKKAVDGLNKVGDADTSGAASNMSETAGSIKESAEGIETDANTIKEKLEGIGQAELSGENLRTELQGIQSAASDTAQSMDEFTRFKVKAAVMDLAQSIPAIGDAWDDVAGTLQMTEQEFDNLVDAQKRAIMESSLAKAQAQSMEAVAEATLHQAMAQDGLNAVFNEANKILDEYDGSQKHSISNMEELKAASDEYLVLGDLWENATDALDEYNTASENLEDANEVQERTAAAAQAVAEQWGFTAEAADTATESISETVEATEEQIEAERAAAEAAYTSQKEIAEIHQETAQAIIDAYDQAKQAAEAAFSVNPFEEWSQNAENGIEKMQAAFDSQLEGMTNYATNLQTVSEHVGKEITPEFLQYLEGLGTNGAQAMQELANAFENGDTDTVDQLMQSYTKAMAKQDEISRALAADAVAVKLGLNELGSTAAEWKGIDSAVEHVQKVGGQVSDATLAAFEKASQTAQQCGVKIPEGLQAGIEAGSEDPTAAIEAATEKLNAAIQGQAEGLLEVARQTGIPIPDGIAEGIAEGGDSVADAYQQLLDALASGTVDTSAPKEAGNEVTSGVSEGITENQSEAEAAAQEVVTAATTAATTAAEQFSQAGTKAGISFYTAMVATTAAATTGGQTIAQAGASGAAGMSGEFTGAGSSDGEAFAGGVLSAGGSAMSAGSSIAQSAVTGASEYAGSMQSVGMNMAEGMAQGIRAKAAAVAAEAAAMVRNAIAAAQAAQDSHSPSRKARDLIGKMFSAGTAQGIKLGTKGTTEAAEHQMNANLDTVRKWLAKNKKAIQKTGMSMSDAVAYGWQQLGAQMAKKGFGVSKTTTNSKGETSEKSVEKYYSEIYSMASKYLSNVQKLYDTTDKEEAKYWTKVRKNLKKGTQAWFDATDKIRDAKKRIAESTKEAAAQVGTVDNAETVLSNYQVYFKMSERAEMQYWATVRKQYKAGTAQRLQADRNYFAAKERYYSDLKQLEKDYTASVKELNDDLAKSIEEKQKDLADTIADINKNLADDMADKWKEYTDALADRTKEIANAFDIFAEFDSTSDTGEKLLFNMKSQAAGYKDWAQQLDQLQKRGVLSEELIKELRSKGPQDSAAIHALNMLSDKELGEYNAAYLEKMRISAQEAAKDEAELLKETNAAIEDMKKQASADIQNATKQTNSEIKDLKTSTQKQINDLTKTYATERANLSKGISADILNLAKNVKTISESQTTALVAAFSGKGASKDVKSSVGTSVGSGVVNSAGAGNTVSGARGAADNAANEEASLKNLVQNIIAGGKSRSKTLTEAEKNSHVELWKYIATKYGRTAGNAMYTQLAGALGIKVDKTVTNKQKADILAALKAHGLASGTRRLQDPFAWMDEAGIGSEMIIRQSDGARLNTNVQPGDAIVPAVNTDNLWKWSQLDPDAIVPRTMSEASMNAYALSKQAQMEQARADTAMAGMMSGMLEIMRQYMPYIAQRQNVTIGPEAIDALGKAVTPSVSNTMAIRTQRRRG